MLTTLPLSRLENNYWFGLWMVCSSNGKKLENIEQLSTFCKPLIAIVNNAVAQEDFNEAKVRPLSDYDTHLNSLESITDEMRLL